MTFRVAVVCPNYVSRHYGGVEAVASWLRDTVAGEADFDAEIISVATSRSDPVSTRVASPSSWRDGPSSAWYDVRGESIEHFGSWAAEAEPARYLPRSPLTRRLSTFDLVQVVSGTPAFGLVASHVDRPVCLQVATTVAAERQHETMSGPSVGSRVLRAAHAASTRVVTRLERRALRRADHTFVENGWMLDHVRSLVGPAAVSLAPPGVDDQWFVPGSTVPNRTYLLTVGRLVSERKNLAGLLRTYAVSRSRFGLRLPLVIAGGGELPIHISRLVASLGLSSHVRVVEDPPADELLRLYQGATLFVLASHEEGLGLVLLEAQSCGVPVVSTDNAGATEVFARGAVGRLVGTFQGTSETMAAALAEWEEQGATFRTTAREFAVDNFGTAVTASRFIGRYRELLRE